MTTLSLPLSRLRLLEWEERLSLRLRLRLRDLDLDVLAHEQAQESCYRHRFFVSELHRAVIVPEDEPLPFGDIPESECGSHSRLVQHELWPEQIVKGVKQRALARV